MFSIIINYESFFICAVTLKQWFLIGVPRHPKVPIAMFKGAARYWDIVILWPTLYFSFNPLMFLTEFQCVLGFALISGTFLKSCLVGNSLAEIIIFFDPINSVGFKCQTQWHQCCEFVGFVLDINYYCWGFIIDLFETDESTYRLNSHRARL